jgi:hypothetical protein
VIASTIFCRLLGWSPKRISDPKTALRALRDKVAERKTLLSKLDPQGKFTRLDHEIARLRIAATPPG